MAKTKAQQIMDHEHVHTEQEVTQAIRDIAAEFEPYIIRQRRHFHKYPEASLHEVRTTSDICGQLDAMNIPYERPLETGVVATLRGTAPDAYRADGTPRRRLLLRADIDALPVTERTDVEYASANEGYMHACGHDCHIAMMLGTLQILRHMTDDIHGEIRIVFQPSEENGKGAKMMCNQGVTEGVDQAFGTDSPITPVTSMNVLYTAVTRQDPFTHEPAGGWLPDERICAADAVRIYTAGSAAACGRERELGQIAPGMLADFIVLDRDITACDPQEIQSAQVLATYVGGRRVFER